MKLRLPFLIFTLISCHALAGLPEKQKDNFGNHIYLIGDAETFDEFITAPIDIPDDEKALIIKVPFKASSERARVLSDFDLLFDENMHKEVGSNSSLWVRGGSMPRTIFLEDQKQQLEKAQLFSGHIAMIAEIDKKPFVLLVKDKTKSLLMVPGGTMSRNDLMHIPTSYDNALACTKITALRELEEETGLKRDISDLNGVSAFHFNGKISRWNDIRDQGFYYFGGYLSDKEIEGFTRNEDETWSKLTPDNAEIEKLVLYPLCPDIDPTGVVSKLSLEAAWLGLGDHEHMLETFPPHVKSRF
ncbi:MAG: NUDIX hydrolase [Deltaproteobacteria bacterium]|nr:NUDIX hydrolase [Deltaproteobacteria bacterium]